MTVTAYLRPEAERDMTDAAIWYEKQRHGLGHEFLDEFAKALTTLTGQPSRYPKVHKEIHRMLMRRFPFGIYYIDEGRRLIVVAIMHASRNPQRWKTRA